MKKIILAVASVLALGLVVGCKQQIEGSLNVTATNYNKSLDASTTKNYVYSASGSITNSTSYVQHQKSGDYDSYSLTTSYKFTPTSDVYVTEVTDPANNRITYTINFTGDVVTTADSVTKISSSADPIKSKTITDKTRLASNGGASRQIQVTKIDNKFYYQNKDGSYKVVEGIDFSASSVDLSKFNDATSTTSVSYDLLATYNNTVDNASATPTDYTTRTTQTASGYTWAVTLTRK